MTPQTILVVDDDPLLRRSLALTLERAGFRAQSAADAAGALAQARREPPALVLLDIGLPDRDGLETMRTLQGELAVPVILVTARRRELDEVLGLELGADDYVTKPFDSDVLLARIRRLLRQSRVPSAPPTRLVAGDVTVDPQAHLATVGGKLLELSPRLFALLAALAERAGQVVTTEQLLARVWGDGFAGEPQVVYVHIRWLRERLEEDASRPRRLVTVHGVGYKLVPQGA